MSESVEQLAMAITEQLAVMQNKLPTSIDRWGPDEAAAYLKVSKRQFMERIAVLPDFPKGVRLPSEKGQGKVRWKAQDIIDWADTLPKV